MMKVFAENNMALLMINGDLQVTFDCLFIRLAHMFETAWDICIMAFLIFYLFLHVCSDGVVYGHVLFSLCMVVACKNH